MSDEEIPEETGSFDFSLRGMQRHTDVVKHVIFTLQECGAVAAFTLPPAFLNGLAATAVVTMWETSVGPVPKVTIILPDGSLL